MSSSPREALHSSSASKLFAKMSLKQSAHDEDLNFLETGAATSSADLMPVEVPTATVVDDGTGRQQQQTRTASGTAAATVGNMVASSAQGVANMFRRASHPKIAIAHVAFKTCAFFVYLFGGIVADDFVITFVICVLMLAFDFWTVKNVTGRIMVGLRWWNEQNDDGSSSWRFESIDNPDEVSTVDYRIFWYSMYINFVLWAFMFFFAFIKLNFDWIPLTAVALSLQSSNIYGYWQCSKDAKRRLQGAVQGAVTQGALSALSSGFLTRAFGRSQSEQTAPMHQQQPI